MDRRPARPPATARRALFHPSRALHQQSHSSSSSTNASRAPLTSTSDPATDLVERDSAGHPIINAPVTGGKLTVHSVRSELEDEVDQENQMIALFANKSHHWDQAAILEEIKVALKASCERKVQSLEGDRWMFEGEGKKG